MKNERLMPGDWHFPWRDSYKGVRKGNLSNYTIRWPAKLRHTLPTARTTARPLRVAAYGHLSNKFADGIRACGIAGTE